MTLRDKTIFILGAAKFDSAVASTSFTIARHLAGKNKVYYVDYPFTWRDCMTLKHSPQYKVRVPHFASRASGIMETEIPNLKVVIVPPVASINFIPEGRFYRFLLKRIEGVIGKRIQRIIKSEGISDYVYINSFNFHYPGVASGLSPALQVYHCVDPLVVEYDRRHGIISEELLVRNSDLVICTSKKLCDEKTLINKNCFFVPNAADITHSSRALIPNLPVHPAVSSLIKPVIGYFGNIERRIDFSLLHAVILANRDKNFVFAGPYLVENIPNWLFNMSNVHFTGSIPYKEMPAMLKGFDVTLIPFKKDEYSGTIFPLKLFEYLGAGKPVVATDFNPDLKSFTGDTVYYCRDAASFSKAVADAIAENDGQKVEERLAVANANTWERRVTQFEEILAEHYPQRTVSFI